jgi:V/A-type H+-transporting ATPase subunit D
MRQFLITAKEAMRLRLAVEDALSGSSKQFARARAIMDSSALEVATLAPGAKMSVAVESKNIMSVHVPTFAAAHRAVGAGGAVNTMAYGYQFTNSELDRAVALQADAVPLLLALAEAEQSCMLMAREIEKTRRRVNALEYVMIPRLQTDIRYIAMKLDENERGAQVRLMKVKDMMLKEAGYTN